MWCGKGLEEEGRRKRRRCESCVSGLEAGVREGWHSGSSRSLESLLGER